MDIYRFLKELVTASNRSGKKMSVVNLVLEFNAVVKPSALARSIGYLVISLQMKPMA